MTPALAPQEVVSRGVALRRSVTPHDESIRVSPVPVRDRLESGYPISRQRPRAEPLPWGVLAQRTPPVSVFSSVGPPDTGQADRRKDYPIRGTRQVSRSRTLLWRTPQRQSRFSSRRAAGHATARQRAIRDGSRSRSVRADSNSAASRQRMCRDPTDRYGRAASVPLPRPRSSSLRRGCRRHFSLDSRENCAGYEDSDDTLPE